LHPANIRTSARLILSRQKIYSLIPLKQINNRSNVCYINHYEIDYLCQK